MQTVTPTNARPDPREQEIDTAAAFLSISGPCWQQGNIYLACVATAGLGMCRHLRASFEQCAKAKRELSIRQLEVIGKEQQNLCGKEDDKTHCAARLVLQQYMPRKAE